MSNLTREEAKENVIDPYSGSDAYNSAIKKANSAWKRRINKLFDQHED